MRKLFTLILLLPFGLLQAQNGQITGNVSDTETGEGIAGVTITLQPTNEITTTGALGNYVFNNVAVGGYTVQIGPTGNPVTTLSAELLTSNQKIDLGGYSGDADALSGSITILSSFDLENEEDEAVSSILTASRDVFLNKAGYQFGSDTYFRVRGYDSRYNAMLINGMRVENPETGWQNFGVVGGLNDVLRYRDNETIGNGAAENSFGEIGGVRNYVLRPSEYRKGGRYTYSNQNKSYNNRAMFSYASGDKQGISYVLSGSHRWAQMNKANIDGTYYDAYSLYAAVEGKVSPNYSVSGQFIMAPRRRATPGIHRQEAYDLAGSNYYNADWGMWNDEPRSARLRKNDNPLLSVSNYISIGDKTDATVTAGYMTGHYAASRIDRASFNYPGSNFANNPDPDYYRNLPSFAGDNAAFYAQKQIDWAGLYRKNQLSPDGRAHYVLEENYRDDTEWQAVAHFNTEVNSTFNLNYGANYKRYNGNFYKKLNDLLGAQYWSDTDSFNGDESIRFNDTDTRVTENEVYGYDYDINRSSVDGFVQGKFTLPKFDIHVGGMVGRTQYWRDGAWATTDHPDNSEGQGPKKDFDLYGGKAGATYKINGRNYVSVNGTYYKKAPFISTIFKSPRSRNSIADGAKEETIYSGEANYIHNSPGLKIRLSGYYTEMEDQAENVFAFSQGVDTGNGASRGGLVSFYQYGIDKRHYGGELGFAAKISPEFEVNGAAAMGKYTFTNRPTLEAFGEEQEDSFIPKSTVFHKNFYEDNTPQTAANLGITYRAPFFMFVNVDGNYYNDSYAGTSAFRRTFDIARQLDDSKTIEEWTTQERLPEAFRLNVSMYKSIRLSSKYFLGINLSAQNLLDDNKYPNLAFEDIRLQDLDGDGDLDPDGFPTRYRFALGRSYFLNAALRFR